MVHRQSVCRLGGEEEGGVGGFRGGCEGEGEAAAVGEGDQVDDARRRSE